MSTNWTMGAQGVSRELPVTVNPLRRQGKPPLVMVWPGTLLSHPKCDLRAPEEPPTPLRSPPLSWAAPHSPPQVWPGAALPSRSKIAVPYNTNWGPSLLLPSSRYHQKYHYRHLIRILGDHWSGLDSIYTTAVFHTTHLYGEQPILNKGLEHKRAKSRLLAVWKITRSGAFKRAGYIQCNCQLEEGA